MALAVLHLTLRASGTAQGIVLSWPYEPGAVTNVWYRRSASIKSVDGSLAVIGDALPAALDWSDEYGSTQVRRSLDAINDWILYDAPQALTGSRLMVCLCAAMQVGSSSTDHCDVS